MYAFGHGVSYATFDNNDLTVEGGETTTASCTVTNKGKRSSALVVEALCPLLAP